MSEIVDVRLKFSKNGPIRFVGHLDVMRYFQKANRRAGLPMRYSEGFSPHQIMSFALPLSVGATSDGEYLDMSLTEEMPPQEIVDRLQAVLHEGIEARACIRLPEHAPKAMTVITAARYRLTLAEEAMRLVTGRNDGTEAGKACAEALQDFLGASAIPVEKKTKKGMQTVDIRPLIHEAEVADDGTLTALLHAGSKDHVKPALLYEEFFRRQGTAFSPVMLKNHRIDLYQTAADEKGEHFVPLIAEA